MITPANNYNLQMAEVNHDRYQSQRYKRSQVPLPEATSNDYGRRQSLEDNIAVNQQEEEKKMSRGDLRALNNSKAAFNSFVNGEDPDADNNYYFNKDSIVVDKKSIREGLTKAN